MYASQTIAKAAAKDGSLPVRWSTMTRQVTTDPPMTTIPMAKTVSDTGSARPSTRWFWGLIFLLFLLPCLAICGYALLMLLCCWFSWAPSNRPVETRDWSVIEKGAKTVCIGDTTDEIWTRFGEPDGVYDLSRNIYYGREPNGEIVRYEIGYHDNGILCATEEVRSPGSKVAHPDAALIWNCLARFPPPWVATTSRDAALIRCCLAQASMGVTTELRILAMLGPPDLVYRIKDWSYRDNGPYGSGMIFSVAFSGDDLVCATAYYRF